MKYMIDENKGYCEGGVRIYSPDGDITIEAGKVTYDGKTKIAVATVNPKLIAEGDGVTVTSVIMRRNFETDEVNALSNVTIERAGKGGGKSFGKAGMLEYATKKKIAYLRDNPSLVYEGSTVVGETIEYNLRDESIDVLGGCVVDFAQEGKGESNRITADRVLFQNEGGKENAEAFGNVRILVFENNTLITSGYAFYDLKNEFAKMLYDPKCYLGGTSSTVRSDRIEYRFENNKEMIEFFDNVLAIDKEENMIIEAGHLVVDVAAGYLRITETPVCYMDNRKVKITAVYFERFDRKRKLRANGDVVVVNYNNAGEVSMKAFAAMGVYDRKRNRMILKGGAPRIVQGEKEIRAREIKLYPETERVELVDPVGVLEK